MNNYNFLIVLCGLPSSGKSSFSEILKVKIENDSGLDSGLDSKLKEDRQLVKIVDFDKVRYDKFGENFFPEQELKIRNESLEEIKKHLENKTENNNDKIVISDDINYYTTMRHQHKKIAEELRIPFFIVYISTPLENCLVWNSKRGTKVPNSVIEKISKKFDIPGNKYLWDKPVISIDLSLRDINKSAEKTWDIIQKIIKRGNNSKLKIEHFNMVRNEESNYIEQLDIFTKRLVNLLIIFLKNKKHINRYNNLNDISDIILKVQPSVFDNYNDIIEMIANDKKLNDAFLDFVLNYSGKFDVIAKKRKELVVKIKKDKNYMNNCEKIDFNDIFNNFFKLLIT